MGAAVEERRFRANIFIDTGDRPQFLEDAWNGAELAIGSEVVVHLGPGMPRCMMVDQAQAGVAAGRKVLKSLGAHHDMDLGLQARAARIGTLRVGDVVTLRQACR